MFDAAPNMERLLPPAPGTPLPPPPAAHASPRSIDRVFRHALGRAPSARERAPPKRRCATRGGSRPFAPGLADLLWAVTMKPEFQLIY